MRRSTGTVAEDERRLIRLARLRVGTSMAYGIAAGCNGIQSSSLSSYGTTTSSEAAHPKQHNHFNNQDENGMFRARDVSNKWISVAVCVGSKIGI